MYVQFFNFTFREIAKIIVEMEEVLELLLQNDYKTWLGGIQMTTPMRQIIKHMPGQSLNSCSEEMEDKVILCLFDLLHYASGKKLGSYQELTFASIQSQHTISPLYFQLSRNEIKYAT